MCRSVLVCRGVTCAGFLADDVFRALRASVDRAGLRETVSVERAGCFARCGGGVTVVVRDAPTRSEADGCAEPFAWRPTSAVDERAGVVYPEVSAPEVPRIVEEHLRAGRPVAAMLVARRGAKTPSAR